MMPAIVSGDRPKTNSAKRQTMAALTQAHDWASTPLGEPGRWPESLKAVIQVMLDSRYAMWLGWGADLTFFYNDAYAAMTLGPKHPWALGKSAREVWAEIWPDIGPRAEQVMSSGEATWDDGLLLFLERNDFPEETYHTFSYSPVRNGNEIGGMLCVVTEDTERKIAERRLKTLRELADRSNSGKTVEEACRAAADILGANPHDVPMALIYRLEPGGRAVLAGIAGAEPGSPLAPESVEVGSSAWRFNEVLARKQAVEIADMQDIFGSAPLGSWPERPTRAVVQPIAKSGTRELAGFLVGAASSRRPLDETYREFFGLVASQIATAITSAQAFAHERDRAEQLAAIDKAKTVFFSNVSHEFRTPLTLMLSPVEELLAKSHTDLPPAAKGQLEVVNRNGQRLLRLVNTLLDFSRIEAGRVRATFRPTDLAAFTTELASVFRSATERAGLALVVDAPPIGEPVYVDREMWEKIVLNLLSNAFKFTFDGEILVALRSSGDVVELSISDTGTGIPAEELERVFERFHRIENARGRTHEGSGIGLALVQELTRLHGGSVRVASRLGKGSTFTVTIPLGRDHLPADQMSEAGNIRLLASRPYVDEALRWLPDAQSAKDTTPMITDDDPHVATISANGAEKLPKVLIADDNSDMRQYLSRLLATRFRVEAVTDGVAALAAAQREVPDLVLTDVMMPQLDGFGLLAAIRADPRLLSVPVVMVSARAGEEARVEGIEAGADDYLIKPFSARELVARVESNLKLANQRRYGEARIAAILESMQDGFYSVDEDFRFTRFNAAARRAFAAQGLDADALLGKHIFDEVLPEAREDKGGQALLTAMTERRSIAVDTFFAPWRRWFHIRHDPTPDGGVATFFLDITEQKEGEERQRLLLDELNHRVKNTLAIVQSIAAQTARVTPAPPEFAKTFSARLSALAGAHSILTQRSWQHASLSEIAAQAMAPFRPAERVRIDGPDAVMLPTGHTMTMALLLNELATNATKYGALSTATGRVDIRWLVSAEGDIEFTWIESGGPGIEGSPERKGFGSRLIEMSALQLNAQTERVFAPTGLHIAMRFPLPPKREEARR